MPRTARAAVLRGDDREMTIAEVRVEEPRANEVLVRIVATGVCHTDMIMRDGGVPTPRPVVLGHEGAGIVEAIGSGVTSVTVGDPVVLAFDSCGHCRHCAIHQPAYCHHFFPRNFFGVREDGSTALSDADGPVHSHIFGQSSFATHAIAHERNTVKIADDVPLELMGPLGCGVMTGAGAVMNALKVAAGASLGIFGSGAVGLSALLAGKAIGAGTIVAIDRNEARLDLARELGATHAILPGEDLAAQIRALVPEGLDYAIDTTAHPAVVRAAADSLGQRGTLGLVGAGRPGDTYTVDAVAFMSAGQTMRGIVEGDADPQQFIPELVDLHRAGRFPFDRLVRFYPFDQINQAIADGESGRTIKPIVRIG